MTEMAHSVQEVAHSAQNSLEMVQQVETASESGRHIMSNNITTINQLETRLNDSVEAVGQLRKHEQSNRFDSGCYSQHRRTNQSAGTQRSD